MNFVEIFIHPDGTVQAIYSDDVAEVIEEGVTTRASHVEPCLGGWTSDLSPVGGPTLGPFKKRNEALAAEVMWLRSRLEQGRLEVR